MTAKLNRPPGAGKRGPVKGFKHLPSAAEHRAVEAKKLAKVVAAAREERIVAGLSHLADIAVTLREARALVLRNSLKAKASTLSAADRENPARLSGDLLREFAWRRGLAKSQIAAMSDAKIREQLSYVIRRQYEDAEVS